MLQKQPYCLHISQPRGHMKSCAALCIPGLKGHASFIYKERSHVKVTLKNQEVE
jgi:hypothetical protein